MTIDVTIGRRAWISECGTYRWTLDRIWGTGGQRVLFIGLNPSTADAQIDDPTVLRWTHFARAWGFDQFTAVNLYPFRSPSPKALRQWVDRIADGGDWLGRDAMYFDNTRVVRELARTTSLIVPCWGAAAWDLDWIETMVEVIFEAANLGEIHCLGETASGAPMHPMARGKHRIPDNRQPILWRSL